ncbi:MAG: NAD(P)-dependent oxidoreductase [Verrucomicrobiota bacterium]|jgi:3-hydroxyisobutyrate dehydrogenase|nr:NAD(P)-dependent oxidoreductase [Verrucomicrobiales bacterium]MEE2966974.1 NAD(P)-dependent oxidoreductase [Verrucomicrobiota bacterium]|tara:strand:+ start:9269 stop:10153 length:885 start_codon:yes stop_codon:yes gene_type:complete
MSQKIGFVGIGRMGANMARNLKDRGYTISSVNDINKEAAAELAQELGCSHAENLADVTESSDIIFTVITNDDAMRSIYFSDEDNLLQNAEGKTFVNCATLSPGIQQEVAKAAEEAGAGALEGCMASSIPQAREGKLYLMIGGKAELFDQMKPVLEDMSINLKHIGEIGKAAQVKALVNMVMNINTAGLAEGLGLADSLGLDLEMVCDVFSQTGANSRVLETDAEDMIARDHEAWFSAEHAAKDSGIAADIAKEVGISLPLNDATCAQFNKLVTDGKGDLDKSGVAELTFKGRHP